MKQPSITVTLPHVGEVDLTMLGSVGPLTYWLDATTHKVYSYNLEVAKFVDRGTVRDLAKLPPTLRPVA